jgi:hypothetical protein
MSLLMVYVLGGRGEYQMSRPSRKYKGERESVFWRELSRNINLVYQDLDFGIYGISQ